MGRRPTGVHTRSPFSGLCPAIVQSTGEPGRIRVTANSTSLQFGNTTISTRAQCSEPVTQHGWR